MSKIDESLKNFWMDNARFADAINGFVMQGKQLVNPSELEDADSTEGIWIQDPSVGEKEQRRDVVRKVAFGMNFAIIGIENQETVNYAEPFRVMSYDVSRYGKQVSAIRRLAREKKKDTVKNKDDSDRAGEFLYAFASEDRLSPVLTIVLYFGAIPYDGAKDLHGLLDFSEIPKELQELVPNYPLYLIDVRRMQDFSFLHTLRAVCEFIAASKDKTAWREVAERYPELDIDAYNVVRNYASATQLKEYNKSRTKGGKVVMCEALDQIFEEGRAEGKEQGRAEGRAEGRNFLIINMNKGGIPISKIAEVAAITEPEVLAIIEQNRM